MERDFTELAKVIRQEVLDYLVKREIDLSQPNAVHGALDMFYSNAIIEYMDKHNLELGYIFKVTDDNDIEIEIWEW